MDKKINIAIIPARGDSKSVPGKNIKLLNGKPLIYYSIKAAKNSGVVDKVFVSTDSKEIKKVAEEYGAEVVSQEGTEDSSGYNLSKESYLISSVSNIEKKGFKIKDIVFLQATSPFTSSKDIEKAYEIYREKELDSLFSVTTSSGGFKCGGFIWEENKKSLNYDYKQRKPRQQLPKTFLENGAFYIFSKEGLFNYKNRIYGKFEYFLMPTIRSFEIDEPEDWSLAELIMEKRDGKK